MCVIMCVETSRPTEVMIRKAFQKNAHGFGVAWREDGHVRWKKGLDLDAALKLCAELPLPFVAHFRNASPSLGANNGKIKELCHPFAVDFRASAHLEGRTKGSVLFHNGWWGVWKSELKDAIKGAKQYKAKLPKGNWSDSRAMAFCLAVWGEGYADLIDEKIVVFGPNEEDLDVQAGTGWKHVNDVWCSNDEYMNETLPGTQHQHGWQRPYQQQQQQRHALYPYENREVLPLPAPKADDQSQTKSTKFSADGTLATDPKPYCAYGHCMVDTGIDEKGYCPDHKDGVYRRSGAPVLVKQATVVEEKAAPEVQPSNGPFLAVIEEAEKDLKKGLLSKREMKRVKKASVMLMKWWPRLRMKVVAA